jgi:RNA polymerase sigma factor (sigma-70 family)
MTAIKARLGEVTVDALSQAEDFRYAMSLAANRASRWPLGSYMNQEIMSAAHLGYTLALRDYSGAGPFRHYLATKVIGEIKHAIDKEWRNPGGVREWGKRSWRDNGEKGTARFSELDPYEDGHLAQRVPSHEDAVVELLAFKEEIAGLPERWRQAVELRYLCDMELKDIGRELGISGPRVHQILEKALRALKENYEEEAVCCVTQ